MGETTVTNYPYGPIGSSSVGWSGQGEKGRSLGGNTRSLGRKALDSDEEREEVRGNMRSLGRKTEDSRGERGGTWEIKEKDRNREKLRKIQRQRRARGIRTWAELNERGKRPGKSERFREKAF